MQRGVTREPRLLARSDTDREGTSAAPAQEKDTPITTGAELCSLATAAEATSTLGTPKPFAELDPQDTKTTRR